MKYQKLIDLENKIRESSAKCISSSDTEVLEKRVKDNHPIRNWIGRHPYITGSSVLVASACAVDGYARTILPPQTVAAVDIPILVCAGLAIGFFGIFYMVAMACCDY